MLEGDGEFVGNDVGECGLAEAGRAVEENVVKGFATGFGGLNSDVEIFFDLILADEFGETLGTKLELKRRIVFNGSCGDEAVIGSGIFTRRIADQIRIVLGGRH